MKKEIKTYSLNTLEQIQVVLILSFLFGVVYDIEVAIVFGFWNHILSLILNVNALTWVKSAMVVLVLNILALSLVGTRSFIKTFKQKINS